MRLSLMKRYIELTLTKTKTSVQCHMSYCKWDWDIYLTMDFLKCKTNEMKLKQNLKVDQRSKQT